MLTNMMQWLLDQSAVVKDALGDNLGGLLVSPFKRFLELTVNNQVIGMLNWIFPMSEAVALLQLWGAAIAVWYVFIVFKRIKNEANLLG